jgi:hypothetical protein
MVKSGFACFVFMVFVLGTLAAQDQRGAEKNYQVDSPQSSHVIGIENFTPLILKCESRFPNIGSTGTVLPGTPLDISAGPSEAGDGAQVTARRTSIRS